MQQKTHNREMLEFNNSKKNQRLLAQATDYVFVSCPDFSHENGKYTFKTLGTGMPLSFSLALPYLQQMTDKPMHVFLSDHEAYRKDVQTHLGLNDDEIFKRICKSKTKMMEVFFYTRLLSDLYPYFEESWEGRLPKEDATMQQALIQWSEEGLSLQELKERYTKKYVQMHILMDTCRAYKACPIFLYSKFNLNLVSNIRKQIPIPVLFLDVADPH